ncbi:MAG: hypothetical protein ACFBZ8_01235 [Opitutales bacterium]
MNIDPTNSHSADRLEGFQTSPRNKVGSKGFTPDELDTQGRLNGSAERFSASEEVLRQRALVKQLMAEPEIRPEVVAQGKSLLEDPDFPSEADVDRLARSLVASLLEEEA